ncbi:NDR1/HIN1-like protein 10 [Abrus precatorius]|uniref:NDR1/HIN1-like protein 10 n=1 Tax=Abrus precatorius TaxID=3816 RepID=A0A8B8MFH2_ABRPR|nr:NDR1/HIN1-like protein 10 [Abrus precatorius]
MADKQPQSNAANNDSSVAQEEQPRHLGRRCCCCLFRIFWILLVCILVFVCLVILVLYILITPRTFKFHVTDAKLAQFNYTANTLRYNLFLNITARNPNKKLKIYYDVVQANAFYEGVRFATTDVNMPWNSYLQNKKSMNLFSAVFSGQHVMVLDQDQVSEFDEDNKDGVFHFDIKINFRIRFRLGDLQSGDFKPRGTCELDVPLSSGGKMETAFHFHPTKCEIDF